MKSIGSLLLFILIVTGILWVRGGQYSSKLYSGCRDQNFSNETCVCYSEKIINVMGGNNIVVATNLIINEDLQKKALETANVKCNNKILKDNISNDLDKLVNSFKKIFD